MTIVAILFGVYAILWATAPFESINLPARLILDSADWPIDNLSAELDKSSAFLSAIGAGLLGSIAVLLGGIVAPAIREENQPIVRVAIWAIITWYVIDGVGSIAAEVATNVAFNTVYLALVLFPLLYREKREPSNTFQEKG